MTDHVRTQITDALATAVTGLSTTADRVLKTHSERLIVQRDELPALLVFRDSEESEHDSDDNLSRMLRIVVKAVVAEATDAEDLLDQIASEVEAAVGRQLGGLVIDCVPVAAEFMRPDVALDKEIVALAITFEVLYRTAIGSPTASL